MPTEEKNPMDAPQSAEQEQANITPAQAETKPAQSSAAEPAQPEASASRPTDLRAHFDALTKQAEAARSAYPALDLAAELNNPLFVRLTAPGMGVDVRTAYEVVHREELRAERAAQSLRANAARPDENGLHGAQGTTPVRTDPSSLTRAERADIRRRVARGEKITF